MQKVSLEKFKKEDAAFIKDNFPEYFRDNSILNIENIIDEWKEKLGFCIMYGSEKVGIIALTEKQDKQLSWGEAIKEEFRGKGIAKEAFKLIVKEAQKEDIQRLFLHVQKTMWQVKTYTKGLALNW